MKMRYIAIIATMAMFPDLVSAGFVVEPANPVSHISFAENVSIIEEIRAV